jgi:hypothetical protein
LCADPGQTRGRLCFVFKLSLAFKLSKSDLRPEFRAAFPIHIARDGISPVVTSILPTVAQTAWLPDPHNGGLLLPHCIFNDPAPESHAFLFGCSQQGTE